MGEPRPKPRRRAVLAIDHGSKRSGFAAADPLRIAVRALDTWDGPGDGDGLLGHVAMHVDDWDVDTLLVGFPFNMDGTAGPRAKDVNAFLERLRTRFPELRVIAQDERLSTKEAEELLRAEGYDWRERKRLRDSWSALVILRDWIAAGEPS